MASAHFSSFQESKVSVESSRSSIELLSSPISDDSGCSNPHPRPWVRLRTWLSRRKPLAPSRQHTPAWQGRPKSISSNILFRSCRLAFIIFVILSLCKGIFSPSYSTPPSRYLDLEDRVKSSTESGRGNVNNEKVFVAANIIDENLIRGVWGENLLTLVELLGKDNVFVSIYENDSGFGTSEALVQLQQQLPCNSSVVTGDHISLSDLPTVHLPNGEDRVQRLTYLSEVRNRLLRPIDPSFDGQSVKGFQTATHTKFDRILFLNDVYFSPLEAAQLLFSTNAESGTAQYRAACALDFVQLFKLYDTFVVRDTDGYALALQFYPWFTYRGSGTSRKNVLALSDAVPVKSCWGGIAAFDATLFQPDATSSLSTEVQSHDQLPVQFRSAGEAFWEAAECCLIFADLDVKYGQSSQSDSSGVFINPYIRTAYSTTTWNWLPFFKRFERSLEFFQNLVDTIKAPEWNPRRLHEPGQIIDEVVWVDGVNSTEIPHVDVPALTRPHDRGTIDILSQGHFETQTRSAPAGGFCGQRRMFVMKKDVEAANKKSGGKNWEKVRVPRGPYLPPPSPPPNSKRTSFQHVS